MTLQPYHLLNKSPWPLMASIMSLSFMLNMMMIMHENNMMFLFLTIMMMLLTMFHWWRDIIRESSMEGQHNSYVIMNMKFGMILFILSEVFFFISFFWAYFHSMLAPNIEIGSVWPPHGMIIFNPYSIPLLNTAILLSSGITITWSHHSLLNKNYINCMKALMITIILGIMFSFFQLLEYNQGMFSMSDSIYGSTFYISTGFHGLHVLIGTIFLTTTFIRLHLNHLSKTHHFGFEASAWYWHFVDVVWLFLYTFIYWWTY
uniref:Cytochrome c oxidase subunit 3 n=1 Tax=Chiropterargas boueti TaxID=1827022 RepID=A0A1P8AG28_9ACAR|nr:cytochrome c oxidase subunit III [Chiropterargas boueti]AMX74071.1 cytochrome c oxidase subunit III [Chiropterargas boueti]AMX74084.1 cytochrome c oxidase subunit III [Chiropterargas boueti]